MVEQRQSCNVAVALRLSKSVNKGSLACIDALSIQTVSSSDNATSGSTVRSRCLQMQAFLLLL